MKIRLPPADVPVIDLNTGLFTLDYYDFFKRLEMLGVLDMFDVNNATPPTNGQTIRWNAAANKFIPGV